MHDWLFVGVGYALTFAAIAGYVASLHRRAARARARTRVLRGAPRA